MSPRQMQTAKPHCVNYVNWSLGTLMGPGGKWENTKTLGRMWSDCTCSKANWGKTSEVERENFVIDFR